MTDQEKRPSDALKAPRRPLLVAAVIAGTVIALSGIGVGAYAIGQAVTATVEVETPATEPTPTEEPNTEPTAAITVSVADLTVNVDGTTSSDADGTIANHTWDFGDGATATGATASHAYAAAGTYTVTLTVTDDDGATGTAVYSATVTAPPPPAPIKCPAGTTPGAVDAAGNESACQSLNESGQQCVAYNDANQCTQWYKP